MSSEMSFLSSVQASDLIQFLLRAREAERASVARRLHDDLGTSLVSAMMDLAFAGQHFSRLTEVPDVSNNIARAQASLREAISFNRSLVEELRPSILDNFGLFAACRWLTKRLCAQARVSYSESYPDAEISLSPAALTEVYRVVEGLLLATINEDQLRSIDVRFLVDDAMLSVYVSHTHVGLEESDLGQDIPNAVPEIIARASSFQGAFVVHRGESGSAALATFPLPSVRRS